MSQLFAVVLARLDLLGERVTVEALVVRFFVEGVVAVGVRTGVVVALEEAGEDGAPLPEAVTLVLVLAELEEPDDCVPLAVGVTVVELTDAEAVLVLCFDTPASANGSRVRLVGVVRALGFSTRLEPEDVAGAPGVVGLAGGAGTSAFAP